MNKWNYYEYLDLMFSNKQRHIQIIAAFLYTKKKLKYESKEQVQIVIGRHLRAAKKLVPFSDESIACAMKKCENDFWNIPWTLETVLKVLSS